MDTQDQLKRGYARLVALKNNLPENYDIHQKFITEYHAILQGIAQVTGVDVDEFKVPAAEVKPVVTSSNMMSGRSTYSNDSFCQRHVLLAKLDGLLGYFQMLTSRSQEAKSVGFQKP